MGFINQLKSILGTDSPIDELYKKLRFDAESHMHTDVNLSLRYLQLATKLAVLCNTSQQHDKKLDAILHVIGSSHVSNQSTNNDGGLLVVITSSITALGGVTQQVMNLVTHSPDREVVVWITGSLRDMDSHRGDYIRQHASVLTVENPEDNIASLKEIVAWAHEETIAGFIHLQRPDDLTASLLPAALPNNKHLFVNVNHHTFSLGSFQYDAMVAVTPYGLNQSIEQKRNAKVHMIHIGGRGSLDSLQQIPKNEIRKELNIPNDAYLTVTVGNPKRSIWDADQSYVHVIGEMLMNDIRVHHLLIAKGMSQIKELIAYHYPKVKNRIHVLERIKDIIPTLKNCDLYLNSFPMGGALSNLDAIAASLPIVAIPTHKTWFENSEISTVSRKEYLEIIGMFVNDFEYRLESASALQEAYRSNHQPHKVVLQYLELLRDTKVSNKEYVDQSGFKLLEAKHTVGRAIMMERVLTPYRSMPNADVDLIQSVFESIV